MGYYTPDGIHVVSGYVHFIPPTIGLLISIGAVVLVGFRLRILPKALWVTWLALGCSVLASMVLLFFALVEHMFSDLVGDVAKGVDQSTLRGHVQCSTRLSLSTQAQVELGFASVGFRDSAVTYGVRGGTGYLQKQAAALKFQEVVPSSYLLPVLDPVSKWKGDFGFKPDVFYSFDSGGGSTNLLIDSDQDLAIIEHFTY